MKVLLCAPYKLASDSWLRVLETLPANGDIDVPVTWGVMLRFNKNILDESITPENIKITSEDKMSEERDENLGANIEWTKTVTNNVVSLKPNANLPYHNKITFFMKGGKDGVKGTNGEFMANDMTISFTTVAETLPHPTTVPADNAVDVAVDAPIVATFLAGHNIDPDSINPTNCKITSTD